MMPAIRGRVAYVFDEPNFDVDRIVGFEALRAHNLEGMRAHAMTAFDRDFVRVVRRGDLLVGGANFGYGHPHGPPMAIMRELGVVGVIAPSFAPLYLAGELAAGFPQLVCPAILHHASRWDELSVDWAESLILNITTGAETRFEPLSNHERALIEAGGLFPLLGQDGHRRP
jgi:3-isopropylmalate/(R)-2-methylmalate dehydratase small subunit